MLHDFILNPVDKFYPDANDWMWNYCIFLGKFTDSKGTCYDLGIHLEFFSDDNGDVWPNHSDATVHGNEPGNYTSGEISEHMWTTHDREDNPNREWKKEVYRRARALNLIKFDLD